MGCWNATCFLTRLPILDGEKIRLVLVARRPEETCNGCYPTGRFSPLMLPLTGHYDDYGGIENLEQYENNKDAIRLLKALCFRYHAYEKEPEPLATPSLDSGNWQEDMQTLVRASVEGSLEATCSFAGQKTDWLPVSVCYAKYEFWEYLVLQNMKDMESDYVKSVSFRINFPQPFARSFNWLDAVWGSDAPDDGLRIPNYSAYRYASLITSMSQMRIAFAPACGDGSQDTCEDAWQRDYYLRMWLAAEELAGRWRWDGTVLQRFKKTCEWDGKHFTISEGEGCTSWKIDTSEPTLVRPAILECMARDARDTIQMRYQYDETPGYTAEDVL